jgi:hypothetical protein
MLGAKCDGLEEWLPFKHIARGLGSAAGNHHGNSRALWLGAAGRNGKGNGVSSRSLAFPLIIIILPLLRTCHRAVPGFKLCA